MDTVNVGHAATQFYCDDRAVIATEKYEDVAADEVSGRPVRSRETRLGTFRITKHTFDLAPGDVKSAHPLGRMPRVAEICRGH